MSSSNEGINPRKTSDASEEEVLQANVTQWPLHRCRRRGYGAIARLTVEVAQMATSVKDIVAQNMAMHELLMQTQGQQSFQMPERSYMAQEQLPTSHSWGYSWQQREPTIKREVGVDISSYAADTQAVDPKLGDNFLP